MNRGFYTLASGMMTRQRSLNAIANNMANGKTPGFKSERVVTTTFEQELMIRKEGNKETAIGKGAPVNMVEDIVSDFNATQLMQTDSPYDIAIQGDGYFAVAKDGGQQYLTRNGHFNIDAEGFLILPDQGRVQGIKGDIKIGGAGFSVDSQGTVYDDKGKLVDTLLIQAPAEGTTLPKYANGMYVAEGELVPVTTPNTAQFVYEGSNVDYNNEMALMMETQRSFQSCSKALTMIDQINQKAVNLGSV
ncbi:MAG: flagellar hook-basal body protein [Oscillospiraceae bacterium]